MNWLLILGLGFALVEWVGEFIKNRKLIYFSKPFVLICIIIWITIQVDFLQVLGNDVQVRIIWFLFGMASCLIGDIYLMGSERFFPPGLIAFLIGHIMYIAGFRQVLPKFEYLIPGIIVLGLVIFVSSQIFRQITKGLVASSNEKMKVPVAVYSVVISIMLNTALLTLLEKEWNFQASLLVAFGALLFYISDVLNAWIRFCSPIKNGRVKVMATYHLSQLAIAIGAVQHFIHRLDS